MANRILLFIAAIREAAPGLNWSFHLYTHYGAAFSEADLHKPDTPFTHFCSVLIAAQCPIPNGFLTAERAISPRRASRFFATEAQSIAADIQAEFAKRLPQYQPRA